MLLVAVAVVALALGRAVVTGLLPPAGQDVVFRTPLVIVVLLVGTIGLMVAARHAPPAGVTGGVQGTAGEPAGRSTGAGPTSPRLADERGTC